MALTLDITTSLDGFIAALYACFEHLWRPDMGSAS